MANKTAYAPTTVITLTAAEDLNPNLFVMMDGHVCGANKKAIGATFQGTLSGLDAPIAIAGSVVLIKSGAAITVTDAPVPVVSDSAGKAIAATTFSATTPTGATPVTSTGANPAMTLAGSVLPQAINGYALDSASGANELIRVVLV